MRSRGVFWVLASAPSDVLRGDASERYAAEDPWAVRQGMDSLDLAGLSGKPERLGRDVKETCRPAQIEPRFDAVFGWFVNWNAVVRPQRRDAFASPAIAMAGDEAVAVEGASDQIVVGDQDQLAGSGDDVA